MGFSGFWQYLNKDGLHKSFDVYGAEPEDFESATWKRMVDQTNGREPQVPNSWRFKFGESHRVGWNVTKCTDFEGNEYKTRKPVYRPPTKEEMLEFEQGIMDMDIPCFECDRLPNSGYNSPEEPCHACEGTGVFESGKTFNSLDEINAHLYGDTANGN